MATARRAPAAPVILGGAAAGVGVGVPVVLTPVGSSDEVDPVLVKNPPEDDEPDQDSVPVGKGLGEAVVGSTGRVTSMVDSLMEEE